MARRLCRNVGPINSLGNLLFQLPTETKKTIRLIEKSLYKINEAELCSYLQQELHQRGYSTKNIQTFNCTTLQPEKLQPPQSSGRRSYGGSLKRSSRSCYAFMKNMSPFVIIGALSRTLMEGVTSRPLWSGSPRTTTTVGQPPSSAN